MIRTLKEPRLWLGLTLCGISALFWLVVLSRIDLSVAYPFVGLSYIIVVLFSRLFLNEQVTALRWLGVVVVAVGIAIVGLSFRGTTGS
jgi:drug/metabolite transporter (DMT)-like permease